MKFCCGSEVRAKRVIKITVKTLSVIAKGQRGKIAEIEIKGHFCPSHNVTDDVKIFAKVEYSTKMIIGVGAENRRFVEHVDSQPMVLIKQDRSKLDLPERKYSTKMIIGVSADNRRFVEHVDFQPMLFKQDRSKIGFPERKYPWPTRAQLAPLSEEDYDGFEEEIVVMDVGREPIWRTWLERPKQEAKTAVALVEGLLEIPSLQGKTRDWSSEKFSTEEKIESVERQPVNHAWLTDLSSFENMVA